MKARWAVLNLDEPRCRFAKVLIPSSMPAPGDADFTSRLPARVRARVVSSNVSYSSCLHQIPWEPLFTRLDSRYRRNYSGTTVLGCQGLPAFILWPTIRSPIPYQGLERSFHYGEIAWEDFERVDVQVGRVVEAEAVPGGEEALDKALDRLRTRGR